MRSFPIFWTENGACVCPDGVECRSPGKHPLTSNGVKDATDDVSQISDWRAKWPKAHWGIATGNGLLVVDLDIKPGKNGVEAFKALGTVPKTRTVRTGSGGLHLSFKVPDTYPNTTGKLGPGIDTRCDGGYVLAPGSGHISGGVYKLVVDAPIADAPEWLLALLRPSQPAAEPQERGFFPPASKSVIQAAREALAKHGPAIEGSGGDEHTFRAAAILIHDFALTDDEALPLFQEWNETCQPPWSESDLHTKLQNGGKYGRNAYGCKREQDAIECIRALIKKWNGEEGYILVQNCRPYLTAVADPTVRATIEREIGQVTGFKGKELGLPKGKVYVEAAPGEIVFSTDLAGMADESTAAIRKRVYQRSGVLCEVVVGTTPGTRTFISDLSPARVQDLMSRCAKYIRPDDKEGGTVSVQAPERVATIIHSRRMHKQVRVIDSVTTAPIFLADGSVLQERGYNEQARVYLDPSVTVEVPDAPTLEDARGAVALLEDLLCDFRFHSDADRSTWLAALLTPLVKASIENAPAPLFVFSASNAGAGKSLLADVLARIVTGQPAENRTYGGNSKDQGEWIKKLTSFVRAGSSVSVFDNVNGQFGDEALDRLITSPIWSDRVLGASESPPVAVVSTWITTGNNSEPTGDTVRRCAMSRIEVTDERPQERTGFKRPLLADYAQENRAELLSAALTILRAYHLAGRPDQSLPTWGSFVRWSSLVRGALVWAGCADPFETQRRLSADLNEPENEAHDFWISVIRTAGPGASEISALANERDARTVLGLRNDVTPYLLRRLVTHFIDKPRNGERIRRTGNTYTVEQV